MTTSFLTLATLATAAIVTAARVWPATDQTDLPHAHEDLAADDSHLATASPQSGNKHSHIYVVDDQHPRWPT